MGGIPGGIEGIPGRGGIPNGGIPGRGIPGRMRGGIPGGNPIGSGGIPGGIPRGGGPEGIRGGAAGFLSLLGWILYSAFMLREFEEPFFIITGGGPGGAPSVFAGDLIAGIEGKAPRDRLMIIARSRVVR